jgi:HK97 family phage prohead protease
VKHLTIAGRLKFLPGSRQVVAIISTENVDRAGDIVRSKGCDARGFLAGGSILWNHDQNTPIARCVGLDIGFGQITSTAEFPQPGVSAKSDEIYGLIKAGVVNATSIGFIPRVSKPIGKSQLDISEWTLLEWSFVSCPANDGAQIVSRAAAGSAGRLSDQDEARLKRGLEVFRLGGPPIAGELLDKLGPDRRRRIRAFEVDVLRNGSQ